MANISSVANGRTQELEQKRQQTEMKAMNASYHDHYQEMIRKNEALLKKTQDDYDIKIVNLKNDLETKLIDLRNKQEERTRLENERLETELADLRKAHHDQKQELKSGQDLEIQKLREDQTQFMEGAKRDFEKKMRKYRT